MDINRRDFIKLLSISPSLLSLSSCRDNTTSSLLNSSDDITDIPPINISNGIILENRSDFLLTENRDFITQE